jgi:UDP-sugar transporter A1/2/3
MGFGAVLMATLTSGFAGVYFEKILKTGPTSVWVRNIQLAIFGTIFGLAIVICFDYKAVMDKGFFQGYSTIVWIVIFLQVYYIYKDFIDKNLIFSRLLVV